MSIKATIFWMPLAALVVVILFSNFVRAQQIEAIVTVTNSNSVKIQGKLNGKNLSSRKKNWSFLQSVAGIENLSARVSDLQFSDELEKDVSYKQLIAGEYLTEQPAENFAYQVNLQDSAQKITAHASWSNNESGLLLLRDLLPQLENNGKAMSGKIKFVLPENWKVLSSEKIVGENIFQVVNLDRAVFFIGKNLREIKLSAGKMALQLNINGEWQFSDAEAAKMAGDIYNQYERQFGEDATETIQISLIRSPKNANFGRWNAETLGANVTIVSSDMAFKTQSLQLLHEQLRHELLHLWIPNNLALTGNYDWFYEGFSIYQALRTGVEMNQIRFEDFLDTLAQAANIDNFQDTRISLIEASKNRFNQAGSSIYARGMLLAFLCDVALLRSSKGKTSSEQILREIYRRHKIPNTPIEANQAIVGILRSSPELNSIVEKYLLGAEKINWKTDLQSIGIEAIEDNFSIRLQIKAKLDGKQKDLLNKLGYNNWRKISGKSK